MFLNMEKSKLIAPGERTSGKVRDTFPKVKDAGRVNVETSNHSAMRFAVGREAGKAALDPFVFGREPPPRLLVLFVEVVRASGVPALKRVTPLICQPPKNHCAGPRQLEPSDLPFPTGNS